MQNHPIIQPNNFKQDQQDKRFEYGKSPSQFNYSGSPAIGSDIHKAVFGPSTPYQSTYKDNYNMKDNFSQKEFGNSQSFLNYANQNFQAMSQDSFGGGSTQPYSNYSSQKDLLNSGNIPPSLMLSKNNSIMSNSSMYRSPEPGEERSSDTDMVVQYILQLRDPEKREQALSELSKKRESFPHLAPMLWHSFGTIAIFLQEIALVYQNLQPAQLSQTQSSRICSVLGLLQCLALHPQTRSCFLRAHIPLFLYPFLNTSNKSKAFENLRVTSLGVIGALVKGDDPEAINFLMQTEIIPLCLRIMKKGQELSRTVATFIVQKILLDDNGLSYICQTPERFFAVSQVLQTMIDDLHQQQKDDQRLLRHIIRCYLRLSENQKAGEVLKKYLPPVLKDPSQSFIKDEVVRKWHNNLLQNLQIK